MSSISATAPFEEMRRGPPTKGNPRIVAFCVRFTREEMKLLRAAAGAEDREIANYIRVHLKTAVATTLTPRKK